MSNLFFRPLLFGLLLLLLLNWPTAVVAQNAAQITLTANAGFDGHYKPRNWFPVQVSVRNDGPPIEGELRVYPETTPNNDLFVYRAPISLPTQSAKEVTIYVQLPIHKSSLAVTLVDQNGNQIASAKTNTLTTIPDTSIFYGVVTPDPGEFSFLESLRSASRPNTEVAFLQIEELPDLPHVLGVFDVLLFNDTDTSQLTAVQQQALRGWIKNGGQLLITGGANWQKTAAVLTDWLPVTPTGTQSVEDFPTLTASFGTPFRDPGPYVVTTSSLARGDVLLHEQGLPLLAVTSHGRGNVFFLALDPRYAPLLDWDGTDEIFKTITDYSQGNVVTSLTADIDSYSIRNLVNRMSSATLPPVWALALFLLLYTLVVGPINYLVLKKYNKLEMAWVTLPLLIVLFTAVSYTAGGRIRGSTLGINQIAIAYSHSDSDDAQLLTVLGLFSPERTHYNLQFPNGTLVKPYESSNWKRNVNSITYDNQISLDNIQLNVSDVEVFMAETTHPAIDVTGQGSFTQQGNDIDLDLLLQNNSDIDLQNTTLYFVGRLFEIGDLPAGGSHTYTRTIPTVTSGSSSSRDLGDQYAAIYGYPHNQTNMEEYIRYPLLSSISTSIYRLNQPDTIFVLGWSTDKQIDIQTDDNPSRDNLVTLHIIEIPLTQAAIDRTQSFNIPPSNLEWRLLPESTNSDATPASAILSDSTVAFEFIPPRDARESTISELALLIEKEDFSDPYIPDVHLWNWESEAWDAVADFHWGQTAVADPTPYLGPNNTIQLKVATPNNIDFYHYLQLTAVYPILTVDPSP